MESDLRQWIRLCENDFSQTVWFHSTQKKFDSFSNAFTRGQLGVHLGTRDQAEWRLGDEPGYLLRVSANVSNLIRLRDMGGWYGKGFVEQLNNNPLTKNLKWHGSMGDNSIRAQLRSLGYDGVIYLNNHEGEERADSIIVFDAAKLHILSSERITPP